ncbi:hypothetical protein KP509_38G028400 [Ceratopteris richardii]|uniref:Uncharacterized protein n=1 Tax=Ceratopteris richardii TaxID=49495 RepID=A0A8T2Q2S3_CERRI|nr:hypothetical protein KP509_38G028400 [Ceratopteris richardii]
MQEHANALRQNLICHRHRHSRCTEMCSVDHLDPSDVLLRLGSPHDLDFVMTDGRAAGPLCSDRTSTASAACTSDHSGVSGGGLRIQSSGGSQEAVQPGGGGGACASMGISESWVPTIRTPLVDSTPAATPSRCRVGSFMYSSALLLSCVTVLLLVLPLLLPAPLPSPPLELLLVPLFIFLVLACLALSPTFSPSMPSPVSHTHPS